MNEGLLLAGEPHKVGHWIIRPRTLRELIKMDEEEKLAVSILLLTADDLSFENEDIANLPQFGLILLLAMYNESLRQQILNSLEYIFEEKATFSNDNIYIGDKPMEDQYWDQMKEVFFAQRYTSEKELTNNSKKEEFNPANEEAREAMERFKQIHDEIKDLKNKGKKESDPLMKLVNAFCAKSPNLNILQVWDTTYYQFRRQFDQVIRSDEYDKTFAQLMAGADPKKLKLVHWTE